MDKSKKELASEQAALAPVSFSELVLGFASAALYYTGDSNIEGKAAGQVNLPLAKQNLDIVYLLREKTRGNLSDEENKLIEEVLGDLSQKYTHVAATQK